MRKFSKYPLIQLILSPIGLLVVIGLVGGLFVSDLFRGIAMRQSPPASTETGPLTASQAPLAYSEKYGPVSDNGVIRISAGKLLEKGEKTYLEISLYFHRHPQYKFYEIGSYEPPALVDKNGGLILGTADFPADRHFTGGENYRTILVFPGRPASYPVTLSLFMGERFSGQYHMTSVSLTGLSPAHQAPASKTGGTDSGR